LLPCGENKLFSTIYTLKNFIDELHGRSPASPQSYRSDGTVLPLA
jgi:hypothetical protein